MKVNITDINKARFIFTTDDNRCTRCVFNHDTACIGQVAGEETTVYPCLPWEREDKQEGYYILKPLKTSN